MPKAARCRIFLGTSLISTQYNNIVLAADIEIDRLVQGQDKLIEVHRRLGLRMGALGEMVDSGMVDKQFFILLFFLESFPLKTYSHTNAHVRTYSQDPSESPTLA